MDVRIKEKAEGSILSRFDSTISANASACLRHPSHDETENTAKLKIIHNGSFSKYVVVELEF